MPADFDEKKSRPAAVPQARRSATPPSEPAPSTIPDMAPAVGQAAVTTRTEMTPELEAYLELCRDAPAPQREVVRVSDLPMPSVATPRAAPAHRTARNTSFEAPPSIPASVPDEPRPPEATAPPPVGDGNVDGAVPLARVATEARTERRSQGPIRASLMFAARVPAGAPGKARPLDPEASGAAPSVTTTAGDGPLAPPADLESLVLEPVPGATPASDEPAPGAVPAADEVAAFPGGWDSYQNRGLLGRGGTGAVYRGYDPLLKRMVALKFCGDPRHGARLLRAAAAQSHLENPNVCKVYEVGEVAGRAFVAMELIQGTGLDKVARSMSLVQKVTVMEAVCAAVDAGHRLGLLHCNIKPSNIMVERRKDGVFHPYVLDFGLALDPREAGNADGVIIDSLTWMSPERVRGDMQAIDRRADVYSLGATLYAILGDRPPYQGSAVDVAARVGAQSPPSLRSLGVEVPANLEAIVTRALERRPEQRYDTAQAMAQDLRRFLTGEASRSKRGEGRLRQHVKLGSIAALVVIVLGVLGGVPLRNRLKIRQTARFADRLGEMGGDINSRLRFAYVLPAHDLRPQRGEIRAQLGAIEAEMKRLGALAAGPGHHTLGRGYLVLSELGLAREHLERAWADGYRKPQMALALGQLYMRLYERERGDDAGPRGGTKETEVADATRDKALEYLRRGREGGASFSKLLQAQMLVLEGRRDEARALARTAFAHDPLLFEARVFEGSQLSALGRAAQEQGDFDKARDLYQQGESALRAAIELARSYPPAYFELCRILDREATLPGPGADHLRDQATEVCGAGAAVDPDDQALLASTGSVLAAVSERQLARGQTLTLLDEAQTLNERALTLDPRRTSTYRSLCDVLRVRGELAAGRGQDARSHFTAALEAIARGMRANPSDQETVALLEGDALVRLAAARDGYWHGRDAEAEQALREATDTIGRARGIDPGNYRVITLAAAARALTLQYGTEGGEGPRAVAVVEAGLNDARAAVRMSHDQDAVPLALLADLEVLQSRPAGVRRRASASNLQAAQRALADARRAVAANGELAAAWRAVAVAQMAVYLAQGRSDGRRTVEASKAIERAIELRPGDADLHLTKAGLALDQGGPGATQRAGEAVNAALAIDPARVLGALCAAVVRKDCK